MIEERLKQREAELAEREIDLLQRELNVMILQQQGPNAPTPKKRKGNFKKSRLKLLKNKADPGNQSSGTSMISAPLGIKFDILKFFSHKKSLKSKGHFPFSA